MTVFHHEMKQYRKTLLIWCAVVGGMMMLCVLLFPEMQSQMKDITDLYAGMGDFSTVFGMDRVNFGTLAGFYAIECGNILGLGGAFFAALLGIGILSKEESGHTAEFLLTHPLPRRRVIAEKFGVLFTLVLVFNAICVAFSLISFLIIGENMPWKEFWLFHTAQWLLHEEVACLCFGLSAFLRRGGLGIGLGLATLLYFLNIFGNISDSVSFVKYITPFKYAESTIVVDAKLDGLLIGIGMLYALSGVAVAFWRYTRKDIAS